MSASASLNVGNKTESNVTNSTVNESNFSVNNCTNIVNTLNQETVIVVNAEVGTTQQLWAEASIVMEGVTYEVGGKGNRTENTASSVAKSKAEITANCAGYAAHSTSATDSVMYDISTNGESMQFSDMMSAAKASQTTECSSSGLLSLSCQVGINNSVVSNVNNSIKNIFNMAISNYMSSVTKRNMLLKNITNAQTVLKQAMNSKASIAIKNSVFRIGGEENITKFTAESSTEAESSVMSSVESSATALTSAITNMAMTTTNDITNSQTAISKAEAAADGSTKVSSDSGVTGNTLIWLALIGGVIGFLTVGVTMWAKVKMCQRKNEGPRELEDLDKPPKTTKTVNGKSYEKLDDDELLEP